MRKKSFLVAAVLSALSMIAFAQSGPAGKWTGETQGRQGPQTITLDLKVDAGKLTGTYAQGQQLALLVEQQPAAEITEGKVVDATTISFKRSLQGRGGGAPIEISYTGKIKGDELTLTPTVAGGGGGGRGPTELTLKRAK